MASKTDICWLLAALWMFRFHARLLGFGFTYGVWWSSWVSFMDTVAGIQRRTTVSLLEKKNTSFTDTLVSFARNS